MANSRVLLTGGNGFIGSHTLALLLEKSISVHAVVRSEEKAAKVKRDLSPIVDVSNLSFSIVSDMTIPGAFDACIKDNQPFDVIIHTASPFNYTEYQSLSDYIEPAVQGTLEILASAHKNAPNLKRFVITGSFSAIGNPIDLHGNDALYSSDSWNPMSMEDATSGPTRLAYWGSKKFAEKACELIPRINHSITSNCICV
jgi:nucleoside-diphosphate-sugar epimerase